MKKVTLTIELDYDPVRSHPDGWASAMDKLLATALCVIGRDTLVVDYGEFKLGECCYHKLPARWVIYDYDCDSIIGQVYDTEEEAQSHANDLNNVVVVSLPIEIEEEEEPEDVV